MTITDEERNQEQRRVDDILQLVHKRIVQLEDEIGQYKTEVVHTRKHFWDEVSVNVNNSDDLAETHFSIRQQAEVLSEQERKYSQSAQAISTLHRLAESPYFGRVDFVENGTQICEPIYVGLSSFKNTQDQSFYVYDWRAPVSSLYYDYAPGPAHYQAPIGDIQGEIALKRQYVIRAGVIRFLFDAGVTIGDELLMQVLGRHSDAHMKSIVATIQQEQNRVIRNDHSRLLIVQGAAGSGKTSAALQRVAYLLYKYRDTVRADQMVLFSPNSLFNSYVSTVLPELGEENMQQTTFQEYLEHRLGKQFQVEDPFTQMEFILTAGKEAGYEARIQGIRYKSSSTYLRAIRLYKNRLEQEGMIFRPIRFRGRTIFTSEQLKEQFYSYQPSIHLTNRMHLLRDWLLKELTVFEETERQAQWVEQEMDLLDPEDYQRAYQQLRRVQKDKNVTFDDFTKEHDLVARMVVKRHLKPIRNRIKRIQFVDVSALYTQLFTNPSLVRQISETLGVPEKWPEIGLQTIERLQKGELPCEDATPYLYLKELLQGSQSNNLVRHVLVDEAQDYSSFQLEFLQRLFPRSKMTLLGDLNQAIFAHGSVLNDSSTLADLYGPEQTEVIRLTRSYRSTRPIVEFTRQMVPGGEEIATFDRAGEKPLVVQVTHQDQLDSEILADIRSLQTEGYESIAVICKTAAESGQAYEALREHLTLSLISKFTHTFGKGVLVLPAYLAKGVEFDAVILYNGSRERYAHESERNLFYTACTRAMHLLHIYTLGEESPFIQAQQRATYSLERPSDV